MFQCTIYTAASQKSYTLGRTNWLNKPQRLSEFWILKTHITRTTSTHVHFHYCCLNCNPFHNQNKSSINNFSHLKSCSFSTYCKTQLYTKVSHLFKPVTSSSYFILLVPVNLSWFSERIIKNVPIVTSVFISIYYKCCSSAIWHNKTAIWQTQQYVNSCHNC